VIDHERAESFDGTAVSGDYDEFWSSLPEKVLHPARVPIVEAFRWVGEPLSAIALVDVLDGIVTMWEAGYHLRILRRIDVVERAPAGKGRGRRSDLFDIPYRLKGQEPDP
jgi:hypothetical protein